MWKEKKLKDCDCDFFFFFFFSLPNKRFRWGGAGWSRGWDASFRRVKTHSSPSPVAKRKGGKKIFKKVPHTGLFLLQEYALPLAPSRLTHGPMSKTGWAAASTNLHTHTRTLKEGVPAGNHLESPPLFLFSLFSLSRGFELVKLVVLWEIHEEAVSCYHPCKTNERDPSISGEVCRSYLVTGGDPELQPPAGKLSDAETSRSEHTF